MKPLPKKNDTVSVLGLGRSGMAVVEYFVRRGMRVCVYDDASEEALGERARRLRDLGVPLFSGDKEIGGDFVFRSPAVRPDERRLCRAALRGSQVMGEAELFALLSPAPVYAVSGSDGKTTTSLFLARLLESAGRRVYLGGNIGRSLLPFLDEIKEGDVCVLELSSFQLMDFDTPLALGVLTNLSPNHLNWHKDMKEYTAAKYRLAALSHRRVLHAGLFPSLSGVRFSYEEGADYFVKNGVLWGRGVPLCRESDVRLSGRHNAENLLAAAAATEGVITPAALKTVAKGFKGAPYRLELEGKCRGVCFYNSSIDTSPARTAVSLAALKERHERILLLLGGRGKGLSFAPLAEAVAAFGARPYLFGEARDEIGAALSQKGVSYTAADTMEKATRLAFADADEGDAVLLSPACTSFDAYADFEARGEAFRYTVKSLM